MKEQKIDRYARTARQVESVRRIYSQIGQPLSVNTIIDLHHHLGKALELAEEDSYRKPRGKRTADA